MYIIVPPSPFSVFLDIVDVLVDRSDPSFLHELHALRVLDVGFLALLESHLQELELLGEFILLLGEVLHPLHHATGVSCLVVARFHAALEVQVHHLVGSWEHCIQLLTKDFLYLLHLISILFFNIISIHPLTFTTYPIHHPSESLAHSLQFQFLQPFQLPLPRNQPSRQEATSILQAIR